MDTGTRTTAALCTAIAVTAALVGARMIATTYEQTIPPASLLRCAGTQARLTHELITDVWDFRCATDRVKETPAP